MATAQDQTDTIPPPVERRSSISRSNVSMRDWLERQLTIEDVAEIMEVDITTDKQLERKLQTRLKIYNGPNPFIHVLPFTCYEKFKIVLFCITLIIPLKAILTLILVLFAYIACVLKNCCCKSGRSRILDLFLRGTVRLMLFFVFGFYWIPMKYENDKKPKKWPTIVVANHVSLIDAFILYYQCGAVFVAKKELRNVAAFGSMMHAIGCVWVDRSSKKARKEVIMTIKNYALNPDNVPLCIFPQGTCSNTLTITQFKAGAFIPGVAVLPTAIHYTNCYCDMALLDGLLFESIHTMSQFINFARVQFMAPYQPSVEEQNDATLYANNVRKLVANALDAEMTPHTFDDLLLQTFADKLANKKNKNENVELMGMKPFVMDDVYQKCQMKAKTVIKLGKIYMKHCDEKGRITLDTFCKVFHIKNQTLAQALFELIMGERDGDINQVNDAEPVSDNEEKKALKEMKSDEVKDKFILFDDFLVGVAICYQEEHIDDALTLFFSMIDANNNGMIGAKDCVDLIHTVEKDANQPFEGNTEQFCLMIFDIEQISSDKQLNLSQFKDNVKFHKQHKVCQDFLQFMLFSFLGLKLDENMVVVEAKRVVAVEQRQ